MTNPDHAALERAAREATQGRWSVSDDPDLPGAVVVDGDGYMLADCNIFSPASQGQRSDKDNLANAAYIVAAQPSVILALLEERKRLRGALAAALEWVEAAPHGDNCYLDPGHDLGQSCECGKDSAGRAISAALEGEKP